jgi:hypothetical protein
VSGTADLGPSHHPLPPPPIRSVAGTVFGMTTLLGGLLVVVGSFMPWLTVAAAFVGTISYSGVEGGKDGVITLIIGVLAVTVGAVRLLSQRVPRVVQHISAALGVLVLAIGFYDLEEVRQRVAGFSTEPYGTAFTGPGLYAVIVGGGLITIGGLVSQRPQ